jgi:hypothetical protein
MDEVVISKNGHGDNCIYTFKDKEYQYIRLFPNRKQAEQYTKTLCTHHGYVEIFPWEVWKEGSDYVFN